MAMLLPAVSGASGVQLLQRPDADEGRKRLAQRVEIAIANAAKPKLTLDPLHFRFGDQLKPLGEKTADTFPRNRSETSVVRNAAEIAVIDCAGHLHLLFGGMPINGSKMLPSP